MSRQSVEAGSHGAPADGSLPEREPENAGPPEIDGAYLSLDMAPFGVFVTDSEGFYRFVNKEGLRMGGYSSEQIGSIGLHNIAPESARNEALRLFELAKAEGSSEGEVRFLDIEGEWSTRQIRAVPLPDGCVMAFSLDITDSKRQNKRISHLSGILKASRDILRLVHTEREKAQLLKKVCAILTEECGFLYAWVLINDLPDDGEVSFIHAGLDEGTADALSGDIAEGKAPCCISNLPEQGILYSNDVSLEECDSCPLKGGLYEGQHSLASQLRFRGEHFGYISVSVPAEYADSPEERVFFREVADNIAFALYRIDLEARRTQAEALLAESEERFRTFMESVPVAIFMKDSQSRYIYLNRFMRQRHDPAGEWSARRADEILEGPTGEELLKGDRAAIRDGISVSTEELEDISGNIRTYEVHKFRIPAGDDHHVGGIAIDITDEIKAEAEKRKLEAKLLHTQKLESLGVLAGGIAHDFNNILMAVLGYADLALMEMPQASSARTSILEIEKAARKAADLARQMLAYSGRGSFVIRQINVNEIIRDMGHLLQISISKNVIIKYHLADNLPCIMGDPTQIQQIVMNLITNASEALEDVSGVISVTTSAMECDREYLSTAFLDVNLQEGPYVYIEVSDTGCGMDRETIDRIFDPFFTSKFTGRGLGLSAVLGIVRGHSGVLKVYSEKGRGSSFKILFPTCDESMLDEITESDPDAEFSWTGGAGTILLVDDEESIRSVGKLMLERFGFSVITASDGREALEIFGKEPDSISCVILDLVMPHLGGEATFRELRRIRSDVKVILSSGYNEQDVTRKFVGKELTGFIQKPYKTRELLDKLREVLS